MRIAKRTVVQAPKNRAGKKAHARTSIHPIVGLCLVFSALALAVAFVLYILDRVSPWASATGIGVCAEHLGVDCAAGWDYDGSAICLDGTADKLYAYASLPECAATVRCDTTEYNQLLVKYGVKEILQKVTDLDASYRQQHAAIQQQDLSEGAINNQLDTLNATYLEQRAALLNQASVAQRSLNTECRNLALQRIQQGEQTRQEQLKESCAALGNSYLDEGGCHCSSGYTMDVAKNLCVQVQDRCVTTYGANAVSAPDGAGTQSDCVCAKGFRWNQGGTACETDPAFQADVCKVYGQHSYLGADNKCHCDTGFEFDSKSGQCAPSVTCAAGQVKKNNQCMSYTLDCQQEYGLHVYGVKGQEENSSSCYCDMGFQWNKAMTACVAQTEGNISSGPLSSVAQPSAGAANAETVQSNSPLAVTLMGRILLQVQSHGEAWYVNPKDYHRYYMKDGPAAYQMMRSFGAGIADSDISKIPSADTTDAIKNAASVCATNALANRMKGKILLQVQKHGEAWYVYPKNCRRIYMKDGNAAYQIMRYLGLGITNADLQKIPSK